ncbi:MAG TPA: YtxH domain-containing protein [Dehalococcoidia bacterium]|nr:YtxH domain-containing protein [Dehalococcoidia bacterium]
MRFLLGVALGIATGLAAYLLLSPARKEDIKRRLQGMTGGQEPHLLQPLRQMAEDAASQARQAWEEARQAARQAEQEMLQRYQRLRHREDERRR